MTAGAKHENAEMHLTLLRCHFDLLLPLTLAIRKPVYGAAGYR